MLDVSVFFFNYLGRDPFLLFLLSSCSLAAFFFLKKWSSELTSIYIFIMLP